MVETKAKFQCEICGKQVKNAGRFEYRHQQYVRDHIPRLLTDVCRICVYREAFGKKGINLRKKQNQVEEETILYAEVE